MNLAVQQLLIECAKNEVMPYYKKLAAHEIEEKHCGSLVTVVDRQVERYLSERLQQLVPGSMVVGEEEFDHNPKILQRAVGAPYVWIVDPIDGTKNFSKGHPDFAMMVAYLVDGDFAGAWIYAPISGKMASWTSGEPVCVDGRPVAFDFVTKPLSDLVGGEHISYFHLSDKSQIRHNREKQFANCISRGCIGIEWVMMLEGELDFVSFAPGNPWDIAAGAAMVLALGGAAFNLDQQSLQKEKLFTVKSATLATKAPQNWLAVRDAMLKDVNWKNYLV